MELVQIRPEERAGEARERAFPLERAHVTDGRVSGYASVWGSLNSHGEIFVPGAFTETLRQKSDRKPLVMGYQHHEVIGKWDVPPTREDTVGLYVEGPISKTSRGSDVEILVNDGALTGLSIGFWPEVYAFAEPGESVSFDTPFGRWTHTAEDWILYILKAEVVEASIVMAPSDDDARLRSRELADLLGKAERALPALRSNHSWEDAAYSMALLLGGRGAAAFRELPDLEHRKLFARLEDAYRRCGHEPPAYTRFPDYASIEFRHDERAVFSDRYLRKQLDSVVAGAAGISGPLSAETREVAEKAIAQLSEALARRTDAELLADLAGSMRAAVGSLRQTTPTD